jgi:NTP pyrophosphatase (non-canonical NTP hydrolase)
MDLHKLRIANLNRSAEWNQGKELSLAFRGNEMAGECGEACNVIKKLERAALGMRGSRATVDDLASELADVLICVDLIAMECGIDLRLALERTFNSTSDKHRLETYLRLDGSDL